MKEMKKRNSLFSFFLSFVGVGLKRIDLSDVEWNELEEEEEQHIVAFLHKQCSRKIYFLSFFLSFFPFPSLSSLSLFPSVFF
jgi:hypothetical protein